MNPISEFWKNKLLWLLIYSILGLSLIYMIILTKPFLLDIIQFVKTVLFPFLIAVTVAYLLHPIVEILHQRRVPRTVAVLLIYSLFSFTITIIIMNLTPLFVKQWNELMEHLPNMTNKVQMYVREMNQNRWIPDSIREGVLQSFHSLESRISHSISNLMNRMGSTLNYILMIAIIPFLVFYMLKDYKLMEKIVLNMIPRSHRKQIMKILLEIDIVLGNYIRGQMIVCMIVGFLAFLGYWWIRMPYPLLLATLVAIFNIIPFIGPFIGATPAILMASTISWKMTIYVIVINLLIQVLEGNVISPQVVGKKIHLHPLVIIFAIIIGGELAGIVGLIVAVPVFVVIKVILQYIYGNHAKEV